MVFAAIRKLNISVAIFKSFAEIADKDLAVRIGKCSKTGNSGVNHKAV